MPEVTFLVLVLRFVVRDGRGAAGAPVDDALAAVDEPVVVPVAEDAAHGFGVIGVHGEALVLEVDGASHTTNLLLDDATVLVGPVPARIDERLAAHLKAVLAFVLELLVHLGLRGDAGMVGAEDPARGAAAHTRLAHDGVLDGIVERVSHMELARDVRRRDDDRAVASAGALLGPALVVTAVEPLVQHLGLSDLRIVCLGHLFHERSSLYRDIRFKRIAQAAHPAGTRHAKSRFAHARGEHSGSPLP